MLDVVRYVERTVSCEEHPHTVSVRYRLEGFDNIVGYSDTMTEILSAIR